MVIAFVDPHSSRGGGQVVLEELLLMAQDETHARFLIMPREGRSKIAIPRSVMEASPSDAIEVLAESGSPGVVLVSNANAGHMWTLQSARRLRRRGIPTTSVAIVHNYPKSLLRVIALRFILRRFEEVIVVEPGLLRLRRDGRSGSWLSIKKSESFPAADVDVMPRRHVKIFARPDRVKGLHLLPTIFTALERYGVRCEVALGVPVTDDSGYAKKVRRMLKPWLVSGARGPDWLVPGDIFLVTSASESACLAAQEALSRSAFVVASRVGLMPYLSPTGEGVRTYSVGDVNAAIRTVQEVIDMPAEEFIRECASGRRITSERAGRWYSETTALLGSLEKAVR